MEIASLGGYEMQLRDITIGPFDNQMLRSVLDAFSRLPGRLKDSELPQEVMGTLIGYIKEEMKQSSDSKICDNKMSLIDLKSQLNSARILAGSESASINYNWFKHLSAIYPKVVRSSHKPDQFLGAVRI